MEIRGAATIASAAAEALAEQAEAAAASGETASDPRRLPRRCAPRADLSAKPDRPPCRCRTERAPLRPPANGGETVDELRRSVVDATEAFVRQLDRAQDDLGQVGANRLADGDTVMTHRHSTDALACIEAAVEQGKSISAVVKETRPRQQGHITAEQLRDAGVPVTLIVDSAARRYLDEVDHVVVGADRSPRTAA